MKWCKLFLALAFLFFVIRGLEVPGGDDIIIGRCNPPMTLNIFIWFLCNDISLTFCSFVVAAFFRNTLSYLFVWFCVGKIIQEFVSPYGYGWFELMWDTIGFCIAIILFVYHNLNDNVARKRNHFIKTN